MSFANGGMKPIKLTKPNCQQAILSFFIPNKMTFWQISHMAKKFMKKMLAAKMSMTKMLQGKTPETN